MHINENSGSGTNNTAYSLLFHPLIAQLFSLFSYK